MSTLARSLKSMISNSFAAMLSQEEPENGDRPPYVVQEAWQQSIEARGIVNNLLRRNKRRTFGNIAITFLFTRISTTIGSFLCGGGIQ